MSSGDSLGRVWVVGPGRVGRALAAVLAGEDVVLVGRAGAGGGYDGGATGRRDDGENEAPGRRPDESRDPAFSRQYPAVALDPGARRGDEGTPPDLIVLTVRDEQIRPVAESLAARGLPPAVVLHTSGALDSGALEALRRAGWACGSMPPIVSIADPERDAPKLLNAWWAVEGDERAVAVAERIIERLDGRVLRLTADAKPIYHAAAVLASNYVTTLLARAEGLMSSAGVDRADARAALAMLATGAVANAAERGPVDALTGPITRGDADTILRHLSRLSGADARLYSVLALATLEIARRQGLDPAAADRIAGILEEAEGR